METGYLASYNNVQKLAQGMNLLLTGRELRQRMAQRSREIAEKEYDNTMQVARYLALYEGLIDAHQQKIEES